MDQQVGAYDLQLAKCLIENHKNKAADILARFFKRDERIKEEAYQLCFLDPKNGQGTIGRSQRDPPPGVDIIWNAPRASARSSSSQNSVSPPPTPHNRHRVRPELPADSRAYPFSPPRSNSSLGSRSVRGDTITSEYVLVPCVFDGHFKEQAIRLRTASIHYSVIREDIVSRLGDNNGIVQEDDLDVAVPHLVAPNSQITVRIVESITLTWRRPNSDASHQTRFFLVPQDLLNTDALLGYADSGEEHPDHPITQPRHHKDYSFQTAPQGVPPLAPIPPSHSYHRSYADPSSHLPYRQTQSRTGEYVVQQDTHEPMTQMTRHLQQSPAHTIVGLRSSRPEHSIPNHSPVAQQIPVLDSNHTDPNRILRLELTWGVTDIKTWLDLDGSADAFFLAFQQQASKRKTMPDRSLMTIYFTPDRKATDDAAYSLSLNQEEMDEDWNATVQWLEKNKNKSSRHIFGTLDVEGE